MRRTKWVGKKKIQDDCTDDKVYSSFTCSPISIRSVEGTGGSGVMSGSCNNRIIQTLSIIVGSKCCNSRLDEQENTYQKDSALAQETEYYREGKSFREVL